MKKVYGLIAGNGDGSSSIRWFTNKDQVDNILNCCDGGDDGNIIEAYSGNEGSPAVILTLPDVSISLHVDSESVARSMDCER